MLYTFDKFNFGLSSENLSALIFGCIKSNKNKMQEYEFFDFRTRSLAKNEANFLVLSNFE